MSAIGLRADIGIKVCHVRRVRFDNFVKYDCKIKEGAVGPGVVPRPSDFNYLQCQTTLTAITGAKGIFPRCKTAIVTKPN
jgi:hypothetical protein